MRVVRGDTRTLDYGSYQEDWQSNLFDSPFPAAVPPPALLACSLVLLVLMRLCCLLASLYVVACQKRGTPI